MEKFRCLSSRSGTARVNCWDGGVVSFGTCPKTQGCWLWGYWFPEIWLGERLMNINSVNLTLVLFCCWQDDEIEVICAFIACSSVRFSHTDLNKKNRNAKSVSPFAIPPVLRTNGKWRHANNAAPKSVHRMQVRSTDLKTNQLPRPVWTGPNAAALSSHCYLWRHYVSFAFRFVH